MWLLIYSWKKLRIKLFFGSGFICFIGWVNFGIFILFVFLFYSYLFIYVFFGLFLVVFVLVAGDFRMLIVVKVIFFLLLSIFMSWFGKKLVWSSSDFLFLNFLMFEFKLLSGMSKLLFKYFNISFIVYVFERDVICRSFLNVFAKFISRKFEKNW